MEVPLEEQRFPEAARSRGTGRREPVQTLGKGRGWRRGGRGGREGRARGVEPAASPLGRWEAVGGRAERGVSLSAGAWQASCLPARLLHTLPSFAPSRLHRPRLRATPVPAAGAGAEPCPREQQHVSRYRRSGHVQDVKSRPAARTPSLPALCRCRRLAGVHRCPGPA